MIQLKTQAIQTALTGNWQSAVELNEAILLEDPDDIDTLNRLAFAKMSLGNVKDAKAIYQKVLTLDNQNPIAMRNLKRLSGSNFKKPGQVTITMNNIFIEEPGKTKVVELINVAEQKIISSLCFGESVQMSVKRMKIFILDNQKQYIGMLPDDLGKRLLKFIDGGNKYEAFIKTVNSHTVSIFIKEVNRAVKFKNQPSFIQSEKTKFVVESASSSKNTKEKHAELEDENYTSDESADSF